MTEYIIFYKYQILVGALTGAMVSVIGVIVLLQRMTFFGITAAQAAVLSVATMMLLEIHSEITLILFTLILIFPFYRITRTRSEYPDSWLGLGFVFFTALSQILLSVGANVQNHLVLAFFGNILMLDPAEWNHIWPYFLILSIVFIFIYRSILSVIFDSDQAAISGISFRLTEYTFFVLLSVTLSLSIYLMGSFYSVAHLIIPGILALMISRSVGSAIFIAAVFSVFSTVSGFIVSLIPMSIAGEEIHLPTSSVIIVILGLGAFTGYLLKRIK
jgi:ABC-type Mn2+/Zn2+ transport system permease subunit